MSEKDLAEQDSARIVVRQHSLSLRYEGPLPQAQEFALYEEACPGAGNRILDYMEAEQANRHRLQDMEMRGALRSEMWGMVAAYSIMVILIGSALLLALQGRDVIAAVFLGVGVLAAVHKFIDGRSQKQDQNKDKEPISED